MCNRVLLAVACALAIASSAVADNLTIEATANGVKVDSAEFKGTAHRFTYDESKGVSAFYGDEKSATFALKSPSFRITALSITYSSRDGKLTLAGPRHKQCTYVISKDGTISVEDAEAATR
jgi:lipopolysaccharide export system protein LptA